MPPVAAAPLTCVAPAKPRNLFTEILGKEPAVVDARLLVAFDQLFHGNGKQSIYHEVGADEAYILDVANGDVRSEGMSYGMMIAVQMDRRREFDHLWRWAKKHMYYSSGPARGYFAWRKTTSGAIVPGDGLPVSAPDGEEYFATALILASQRWGDGAGVLEYSREARELLDFMANRDDSPEARQHAFVSLFDRVQKQVVFYPAADGAKHTNPSYHLPAFYEVWACFDSKNQDLWREAATTSRAYFRKATHPKTGLAPEYAGFDGTPSTLPEKGDFRYDAWRVVANIMMDLHFYRADPWQAGYAARLAGFFAARPEYVGELALDGKPLAGVHSAGLVAMNAMLGFGLPAEKARPFLQELWDLEVPSEHERYYNGLLYTLSLLHVSGKFQLAYR
jgi:oligosaccharide reducing-end xylanase